jgi:hypothetical protein
MKQWGTKVDFKKDYNYIRSIVGCSAYLPEDDKAVFFQYFNQGRYSNTKLMSPANRMYHEDIRKKYTKLRKKINYYLDKMAFDINKMEEEEEEDEDIDEPKCVEEVSMKTPIKQKDCDEPETGKTDKESLGEDEEEEDEEDGK